MTGTSSSARAVAKLAPLTVVAVALAMRLGLMFGKGGGWGYGVDYDEGVYFSAASLVANGIFPWRDFVFVHPPGLLAWLVVPAMLGKLAIGPAAAFVVARWMAAFAGTLSVFLAYRLAEKRAGVVGGLAAGLALALYPETVIVDRGVYLEPVLNLACLGLATCVQRAAFGLAPEPKWTTAAGLLAGAAVAVKLWAGLWLLAALVPIFQKLGVRGVVRFGALAAIAAAALILPAAAMAPDAFVEQVFTFHTLRPPDGIPARVDRLVQIFAWRHGGSDLLAVFGFAAVLFRPALRKTSLFFALVFAGTVAAFLANTTYWEQYNAHLAPSAAVLAGIGAGTIWKALSGRPLPLKVVAAAALLALSIFSIAGVRKTFGRNPAVLEAAQAVRASKAKTACALEPAWLLAADRLPPRVGSAGYFVDTYAMGLLAAGRSGKKFESAGAAFDDAVSQPGYAQAVAGCDLFVFGERGRMEFSGGNEDEVTQKWKRVHEAEPDIFLRP